MGILALVNIVLESRIRISFERVSRLQQLKYICEKYTRCDEKEELSLIKYKSLPLASFTTYIITAIIPQ